MKDATFIEVWRNGEHDCVIWHLDSNDTVNYMQFDYDDCRYAMNEKLIHRLNGYKKLEETRVIDETKVLALFKEYYVHNGYFISGDLGLDKLEWYFPEIPSQKICELLTSLIAKGLLKLIRTYGGTSVYLSGSERIKLIEKYNLIEKWKEKNKNKCSGLYYYERELECAELGMRCYGGEAQGF